jgi:hypothetical protein
MWVGFVLVVGALAVTALLWRAPGVLPQDAVLISAATIAVFAACWSVVAALVSHRSNATAVHARIHEVLNSRNAYRWRRLLHADFDRVLVAAVGDVSGATAQERSGWTAWEAARRIKELSSAGRTPDGDEVLTRRFHSALMIFKTLPDADVATDALEVVEMTLMGLDVLCSPAWKSVAQSRLNREAYEGLLRDTAPHTVPFIAIEKWLRGTRAAGYKRFYIQRLRKIGVLPDIVPEQCREDIMEMLGLSAGKRSEPAGGEGPGEVE